MQGYTHQWDVVCAESQHWRESAWPQLVEDTKLIIAASGVAIGGPHRAAGLRKVRMIDDQFSNQDFDEPDYDVLFIDWPNPPVVDVVEGIHLNGRLDEGHEAFRLGLHWPRDYCTTMRKPYDAVVSCILLRAMVLVEDGIEVHSDGFWEDWVGARELYARLWPDDVLVDTLRRKAEIFEEVREDDLKMVSTTEQEASKVQTGSADLSLDRGPQ